MIRLPDAWRRGRRPLAVCLASGAATALALPPFGLLPLGFFGIAALVLLIDDAPSARAAGLRGYVFAFGYFVLGLAWITNAILVRAAEYWWFVPLATPLLSLLLSLFVAVPVALSRLARRGFRRVASLAGLWVLGALAKQFVGTGFPWNPLGSIAELPGRVGDVLIQPASLVGVHGLTLLVILIGGGLAVSRRAALAGGLALAAWIGFGVVRSGAPAPPPPGIDVVLVQGDVSEILKLRDFEPLEIFRRYLALTRQGAAQAGTTPFVVAWPESASPYAIDGDQPALDAIANAARPALASYVGALRIDPNGRPRNSLFVISPDARIEAVYDKAHLVPFGEYEPRWFPIQILPGGGMQPGDRHVTLDVPGVPPATPLICYEIVFSGQVTGTGPRPAWILNLTNDDWFANGSGPRQHLQAARMRAVEEGLPLARAANSGISALFDARGHEIVRLAFGERGILVRPLPGALPPTLFARFGLWIPFALALVATVVGFAPSGVRRRVEADS